ncbi:MAG TPA: DUF3892 domain-containing protein [Ruminococcaceae bacterium]|nr:DUF3892 domain-containing protein [Oscillospiraceae bacterium]
MNDLNDGRIGNMPAAINKLNPTPRPDAKKITKLIKHTGKITGYELSDGRTVDMQQAVALAKNGEIKGVGVATRNGSEYLRTLPDGREDNNLGNLPAKTKG